MINITKIANREDSFLINYYTNNQNNTLLISGNNVIKELNKAFESIAQYKKEQDEKMAAYQNQCLQGTTGIIGNYPLGLQQKVDIAD